MDASVLKAMNSPGLKTKQSGSNSGTHGNDSAMKNGNSQLGLRNSRTSAKPINSADIVVEK